MIKTIKRYAKEAPAGIWERFLTVYR